MASDRTKPPWWAAFPPQTDPHRWRTPEDERFGVDLGDVCWEDMPDDGWSHDEAMARAWAIHDRIAAEGYARAVADVCAAFREAADRYLLRADKHYKGKVKRAELLKAGTAIREEAKKAEKRFGARKDSR